ncbi:MAG: hypothetical protein ACK5MK_12620 [Dysgonomonas sp.]
MQILQNNYKQTVKGRIMCYLALLLVSAGFLFLFSKATTPLLKDGFYGTDSAIFTLLGQAFLDGKTPYVDFFDHKGPVIIFIEALAQLIAPGKSGIFALQTLSLFVTLVLICKSGRLFSLSRLQMAVVVAAFLLFFRFTIRYGNQTEEYSLPFIMLSLYYTLRFYFTDNRQISVCKALILGFCFSVTFWMRANNAGMICACVVFITLLLLKDKKWKDFASFSVAFALSVLIFGTLIVTYFHSLGQGALIGMIRATFIHNLLYAQSAWEMLVPQSVILFYGLAFLALAVFVAGVYAWQKEYWDRNIYLFCVLIFLLGFLPVCLGRCCYNYLSLVIPVVPLGLLFFAGSRMGQAVSGKHFGIVLAMLVAMLLGSAFIKKSENNVDKEFSVRINAFIDRIPADERDSVYLYDVYAPTYLITGLKPYGKYFILQSMHALVDERINDEIEMMMITRPPLWLLVETDSETSPSLKDEQMNNKITRGYELIDKLPNRTSAFWLYRLKRDGNECASVRIDN